MNAKLPGLVALVRRDVILSEDRAALAELARTPPCATCKLFEHCKAAKVACKAFVAYVHGERTGEHAAWHGYSRRKPTAEWYAIALAEEPPEGWKRCGRDRPEEVQASMDVLAREWMGREVGGREVVGIERRNTRLCLNVRCHRCGSESAIRVDDIRGGHAKVCKCVMHAGRVAASRERKRAEYVGRTLANGWRCVDVEFLMRGDRKGYIPYLVLLHDATGVTSHIQAWAVRGGRELAPPSRRKIRAVQAAQAQHAAQEQARAARLAAAAAVDARFMDPEQWKPWKP